MDLFHSGGPLQDDVNPPARYTLESDSEDELGAGEYGEDHQHVHGKYATSTAKTHVISFDLDSEYLIVGVGVAGVRFLRGLGSEYDLEKGKKILVDDIEIGSYHSLSAQTSFVFISSSLPNTVLYPLSEALLSKIRSQKLSILDIYPIALYISQTRLVDHPIRYLRTSPQSPGETPLSPLIQHFAAPNLLSTQTISSSLIVLAQQKQLSSTLLLLPYPRVPPLPPRTLATSSALKLTDEDLSYTHEWTRDGLQLVKKTVLNSDPNLLEKVGNADTGLSMSGSKSRKVRGDIGEGGMYI